MARLTRALTKHGASATYVGWWRWSAGGPRSAVFSWARPSRHLSVLHKDKVTQTHWAKLNKTRHSDSRCLTSASFCPHDVIRFTFLECFALEPQKTNAYKSFQAEMMPSEPRKACKQQWTHNIHSNNVSAPHPGVRPASISWKESWYERIFLFCTSVPRIPDCLRPFSWVFFF